MSLARRVIPVHRILASSIAAAFHREEHRRWELTVNHWDLPIHQMDPHAP